MTQTLIDSQEDGHHSAELEAALPWLRACMVLTGSPFGLPVMFIFYTHSFHQYHECFRTCCWRKMRLEITVAAGVAHILSVGVWCPWLGEDDWSPFMYKPTHSNLNREIMGSKDELLHSTHLFSHQGLRTALLCPGPWRPLSTAPKPPQGQDCSTWIYEALHRIWSLDTQI